jgi:hypothetical protein
VRLPWQLLAAWFLGRPEDRALGERQGQQAQSLYPSAPRGLRRGRGLGQVLLMDAPAVRLPQKKDRERGMEAQDVLPRVVLLLAALTRRLFRRVLGADAPSFRPGMGQRGDADAATGTATPGAGSSACGVTTGAASGGRVSEPCGSFGWTCPEPSA